MLVGLGMILDVDVYTEIQCADWCARIGAPPVDGVNLRSQMAFYVESRRKCGTISSTPLMLMSSVHLNQMNREARGAGLHRLPELPRQPQKVKRGLSPSG